MNLITKYFFIILYSIFVYCHLITPLQKGKSRFFLHIAISFVLSFLIYVLSLYFNSLVNILSIVFPWIYLSIESKQPQITFVASIISWGISYGIAVFSNFILLFFSFLLHISYLDIPYFVLLLFTGIFEFIILTFLFRIKRFRHGMPFLYSKKFVNIGTFLCLFFLGILTYIQTTNNTQLIFYIFTSTLLAVTLASLIFWWQTQLTKSYLRKLQLLELESLRKELEETATEMEHLKKQNEELGRLIHKDNKLIPAMETAVIDFLSASNQKENNALGQSLVSQLRELSGSRREILDEVSAARSHHFATGVPVLDTLLAYFDRRAEARKMEFAVNVTPDLTAYVSSKISSDDITHLLADLLENAIIAVTPCTSRKIRLQIYPYRKWFVIELSDTGIPFQAESLLQFGIQQLTTHKDSGGSGIGLMDIWKLKEKYHASIHITEYPDSFPFSKRITFLLDHRNQYLIRTWRCEELKAKSQRTDLCILPPGNEISSSS